MKISSRLAVPAKQDSLVRDNLVAVNLLVTYCDQLRPFLRPRYDPNHAKISMNLKEINIVQLGNCAKKP
jgi:hypothetical protein